MNEPRVSVVMSVHNALPFLEKAVDSILQQTFTDFEFIIIDDASTDGSLQQLKSYVDQRIVLIINETNIGLTKSLNKGLKVAKGVFIARMDADDISLPQRLERQVDFLEKNPGIGLCGSWVEIFGGIQTKVEYPVQHIQIKFNMLSHNAFSHPTVMWRRSLEISYDENYRTAQDYELFSRVVHHTNTANIPEILLHYREHSGQVTNKRSEEQQKAAKAIKLAQLKNLHLIPGPDDTIAHLCLFDDWFREYRDNKSIKDADKWMYKIFQSNQALEVYDNSLLKDYWKKKLFRGGLYQFNRGTLKILNRSWCKKLCNINILDRLRVYIKCLLNWKVAS